VTFFCVGLADAQPQDQSAVQFRVRKIEFSTSVQPVHQFLVEIVGTLEPEANEIELRRSGNFKIRVVLYVLQEYLGAVDVAAEMELQALDPVVANHEPQFQGAEAAS